MSEIFQRWSAVRERMEGACRRARRAPETVRLIAVTKTVPAERIRELLEAGHRLLGENRVQEALGKMPQLPSSTTWHMVGHLQRNKARHAVGRFELIHGVDDERLARELDRRAAAAGVRQAVLIEVNLSREATKFGVDAERLPALTDAVAALQHLELRGLMTLPPPVERAEQSRRWFARLRELRDATRGRFSGDLPELSMGMTDDFEVAIEEGATLIRVGRAIFGERPAAAG